MGVLVGVGLHDLTIDSAWQVLYGRDLVVSENAFRSGGPTPHPLVVWLNALLEMVGAAPADRFQLWLGVAAVALALLTGVVAASLASFTASFGCGIAAAAIVLSRPLAISLTTVGYYEILYALLIVVAVLLLLADQAWRLAIGLILAAGTIRTEAWLLAPAVLLFSYRRGNPVSAVAVAACLVPPTLWGLTDLGLSGRFLGSIFDTRAGAEALARDRGLEAVWLGPLRLAQAATTEIVLAWAIGAGFAFRWRSSQPVRAALFFELSRAAAVIATVTIVASVAGASLLIRYFLVPGLLLGIAVAVAAVMAWDQRPAWGRGRGSPVYGVMVVAGIVMLVGVRVGDLRDLRIPTAPALTGLGTLSEKLAPTCMTASVPAGDLAPYVAVPSGLEAAAVGVDDSPSGAFFVPEVPVVRAGSVRGTSTPPASFKPVASDGAWTVWARPAGPCSTPRGP